MSPEEQYAEATREQLLKVVSAADACYETEAEFGHPDGEDKQWLDTVLERCPGTFAWNAHQVWKEQQEWLAKRPGADLEDPSGYEEDPFSELTKEQEAHRQKLWEEYINNPQLPEDP